MPYKPVNIFRPYLAFDSVLCEALQHNLSGLVPPPHHPSTLYPLPTVVFRMFDYTDCPEGPILPGQHSIERWLIEEQLNHILMSGFKERKEVAAQLLSYPLKNKIPLEYIIVEVMFGQIFRLPNPLCLEIAYGSILIELCKLQPSTMPQVLTPIQIFNVQHRSDLIGSYLRCWLKQLNCSTRGSV